MRASKRLHELMHEIRNKGAPHGWIRDDLWDRLVEFWRQEDFKKLKQVNKRNRASSTGGSLHTGGSTTTNHNFFQDVFLAELKRLQEECQAIIDAGDPEDDDTASGPHDLREQVTLLNREIAQQAEAHAQSLAAVEAVCAEKVQTLESTVQTQSQEESELRKAYSDMYSFLTQMRSSGSSSAVMPDMPPPPPPPPPTPPPARSQSPPPRPDQGTSSPQSEDDPDYV
ncbi:hypothetical protein PIB30_040607 [Stylosanthes scabra]|uniref:Uncharacterized protein n=1 Tax=Stylosanthes scabra TaxID=79078 RepID=A0ABU6RES8_9FABA|nr:hypothetical protein [Stylosanthes scabra]